MFKNISQVYIFTKDVDQAMNWYSKFLGIPCDLTHSKRDKFALINVGGIEFCFHKSDEKSPMSPGGSVGYWKVDDFMKTIKRATDLGAEIYRGPIQIENTNRWMAQIREPTGSVFGIEGEK